MNENTQTRLAEANGAWAERMKVHRPEVANIMECEFCLIRELFATIEEQAHKHNQQLIVLGDKIMWQDKEVAALHTRCAELEQEIGLLDHIAVECLNLGILIGHVRCDELERELEDRNAEIAALKAELTDVDRALGNKWQEPPGCGRVTYSSQIRRAIAELDKERGLRLESQFYQTHEKTDDPRLCETCVLGNHEVNGRHFWIPEQWQQYGREQEKEKE